ncbi:hypothetical protein C8R45DRAFT_929435 [Mycena sanguinolenta]|nr:hypothetical protein C8R45DRAFT_929435 [Mycena sanguinolenta]
MLPCVVVGGDSISEQNTINNRKPYKLRNYSEGGEKYSQARFSAKRANGLAKPTNGLASRSAGLGLDLQPNPSPSPNKPVGAGASPFGKPKSVASGDSSKLAEDRHLDTVNAMCKIPKCLVYNGVSACYWNQLETRDQSDQSSRVKCHFADVDGFTKVLSQVFRKMKSFNAGFETFGGHSDSSSSSSRVMEVQGEGVKGSSESQWFGAPRWNIHPQQHQKTTKQMESVIFGVPNWVASHFISLCKPMCRLGTNQKIENGYAPIAAMTHAEPAAAKGVGSLGIWHTGSEKWIKLVDQPAR